MKNKNIEIEIIRSLEDNYIYLIHNNQKQITSVIDPSHNTDVEKVLSLKKWSLNQIINTHHHSDHTNGNYLLKKKWGAEIIGPDYEKNKIDNIDIKAKEGDIISVAGLNTEVIHTPGHTLGHIIFYIPEIPLLFSGDTIFAFGCGRVFEGTMKNMWESLKKITLLDPNTLIYCGHEYTEKNIKFALHLEKNNEYLINKLNTIKDQKRNNLPSVPTKLSDELRGNPFLRCSNQDFMNIFNNSEISPYELFTKLREMKDQF